MDAIDAGGCAPPILTTPKRCEAVARYSRDLSSGYMERNDDGDWVPYGGHLSVVAALQGEVSRLREAATNASATLSHIYHTVPLPPDLEKYAHDDYQRLNAALKGEGL